MKIKARIPEPSVRISIALIVLAIGLVCWIQYQWFSRSATLEIEAAYRSLSSTVMETMSREVQRYAPLLGDLRGLGKGRNLALPELERFLVRLSDIYGPSGSAPRLVASVAISFGADPSKARLPAASGEWKSGTSPLPLPVPPAAAKELSESRLVLCGAGWNGGHQFLLARTGALIAIVEIDAKGFFEDYVRPAVAAALPSSTIEWPGLDDSESPDKDYAASPDGRVALSFNPIRALFGLGAAATRTFALFVPAGLDPYLMAMTLRGSRAFIPVPDRRRARFQGDRTFYRPLMTGSSQGSDRFELREARVLMPESSAVGSIERRLALDWLFSVLLLIGLGLAFAQAIVQKHRLGVVRKREREFVASVTHELRTPVTAIRSAADNMRRGLVGIERMAPYGEMIHAQSLRLGSMIEEVLLFSQVEGQVAQPPVLAPIRTEDFASELCVPLDAIAGAEGIRIEWDFRSLPRVFLGDSETLRLILSNLVANALYHSYPDPEKGEVRVIGKALLPDAIQIVVEDDGRGIAKGEAALVFDPFYRDEASRARHEKGSGLGLFISRRKARSLGGDLALESPYERIDGARLPGCRFALVFPFKEPDDVR